MNEIILIIGMMILVSLTKMTKEELAQWFAETTGSTNPQNSINHLRCQAGKWMRTTTNKWSFCTLDDLMTEGFGVPGYFMNRDGWETKKVLIAKCIDTQKFELISAGAIRDLEGMLRNAFNNSDLEMFNITRDGTMIWWEPNPDYQKEGNRLESIQITFDRKKKGHDGTENTAPYMLDEKKGLVMNLVPATSE